LKINPKTKFFLATDDKKEEHIVKQLFKDAVIIYEKDVVSRSTQMGMQDALVDWLLLSRTSKIICSYWSSFNEEASVVNTIERIPIKTVTIRTLKHLTKSRLKSIFKTHYLILKNEGLKKYILYSYNYRKGQIFDWIRKKL
jgi:hypothetical protein